jgi:hypothetical protein
MTRLLVAAAVLAWGLAALGGVALMVSSCWIGERWVYVGGAVLLLMLLPALPVAGDARWWPRYWGNRGTNLPERKVDDARL